MGGECNTLGVLRSRRHICRKVAKPDTTIEREGTNGGPSESDRKLEGRSVNKNTSVASRIVFLGANGETQAPPVR